jgi:hypothetical protein
MVIMLFGWLLSLTILPPSAIIRSDGTRVVLLSDILERSSAWHKAMMVTKRECTHFVSVLNDWRTIGLLPMYVAAFPSYNTGYLKHIYKVFLRQLLLPLPAEFGQRRYLHNPHARPQRRVLLASILLRWSLHGLFA